ncbi:DUF1579 family protein [Pseudoalteromonas rhizosphaerae]|uniref:DUF1579 family protein n=1 Tax=Pseudoalteromonas rhizosphaerae TaxID=2518973 RepID=UPI0021492DBC|nr:DUF1579 family protein [Pseudoalteromonas rhizosphaerae]
MKFLTGFSLVSILFVGNLQAEEHPEILERPEIIQSLDGEWKMSGDVMGKPVTYTMYAKPTLQGAFTEIHMNDIQVPSEYEAKVIIGYDTKSKTIIAHWLDSFGALYSIPHGTGSITSDSIQFTIPYKNGSFRDTFTYDSTSETWSFLLEAAQENGEWVHFAKYNVTKR